MQELFLTSVFQEALSFMARGHNPIYFSTLALAAGGSMEAITPPPLMDAGAKPHRKVGYFIDPRFSNSFFMHHSPKQLFTIIV